MGKGRPGAVDQSVGIGTHARAQTSQGIGHAQHDRVADRLGGFPGLIHRGSGPAARDLNSNLGQAAVEQAAILGLPDGLHRGAQDPHLVTGQDPRIRQGNPTVEGGLPAEAEEDPIGLLLLYHPFDELGNAHMEYVRYRGEYSDLPLDAIIATLKDRYGPLSNLPPGDFDADVDAEVPDAVDVPNQSNL